MKSRQFLVKEIERIIFENNLKVLYPRSTNKELTKRIKQLNKLTYFCDDKDKSFRQTGNRLLFLKNNIKEIPKCPWCDEELPKFSSKFCSKSCSTNNFFATETEEDKEKRIKKSVSSRDYEQIAKKQWETRHGDEKKHEEFKKNASKSHNKKEENGKTVAENRGKLISKAHNNKSKKEKKKIVDKQVKTKKERGINSAETYWKNATKREKEERLERQIKSYLEVRVKNGNITITENKDDWDIYLKAASFKHGFEFTKYTTEEEKTLLLEFGVRNTKSEVDPNFEGVVRDHLLSRKTGFENNIPTWIISHPANCEIVTHAENMKRKGQNSDQITFEELLWRIDNF